MQAIEQLITLVPPPPNPRCAGDLDAFEEVERRFGLPFPDGYKALIIHYGDGVWQGFWHLLNPFSDNTYLNLLAQTPSDERNGLTTLSAERYIKDRNPSYPHAIWPEPGGIIPWAITDNGGRLFWRTQGSQHTWPTIYYPDRSEDYVLVDLSADEIVLGAVTGELTIFTDIFGPDFEYSRADSFVPRRST